MGFPQTRIRARALYKRLQEKIVLEDCPCVFLTVENNLCGKKYSLRGMEMLRDESSISSARPDLTKGRCFVGFERGRGMRLADF